MPVNWPLTFFPLGSLSAVYVLSSSIHLPINDIGLSQMVLGVMEVLQYLVDQTIVDQLLCQILEKTLTYRCIGNWPFLQVSLAYIFLHTAWLQTIELPLSTEELILCCKPQHAIRSLVYQVQRIYHLTLVTELRQIVCLFVISAVHFAVYFSSMMVI